MLWRRIPIIADGGWRGGECGKAAKYLEIQQTACVPCNAYKTKEKSKA